MEGAIRLEFADVGDMTVNGEAILKDAEDKLNDWYGDIWSKLSCNERTAVVKHVLGCPLNDQDKFIFENLGKVRVFP